MDITIRECVITDAKAIFNLNTKEMGYEYPEDETKRKLEKLLKTQNDKIFVATIGDTVVGYIHANDYDVIYAQHMKNIMGIAVSSEYKRKGIGRKLLSEIEKWAKDTNACGVRLVSGATRIASHEFYRHCGYGGDKQQINLKKVFN